MAYEILEKFKKIIGDDPVFVARTTLAPFFMCVPWNTEEHPIHCFFIVKGRDTQFAINEAGYFTLATERFREYYEGKVLIKELEEKYLVYEEYTRQLYDEVIGKNLSKLTDEELREHMRFVLETLYPELLNTIYIETIDYDKVLSVIGVERKRELDTIWDQATQSNFVSFDGRYLRNLIELVSTDGENIIQKAKFMFTNYFWSKSDDEIVQALDDIRNNLAEKTEEMESIFEAVGERERENTIWKETLTPESRRLVDYIQFVMRLRDIRKDPIARMLTVMIEVATVMVTRAGIELRFAPYILLYEYVQGVEYLRSIRDDISTREQGCAYLANPDHSYEISRCDFEDIMRQFDDWTRYYVHDADELKGQIACRGLVRGIARVISDPQDDRGFQDGDILVTSMTRPEFVPIMKRAGAVITNEGGITCHAAIVSRELKKPCIIGTKIATQVLKDGDLVEVDADNGVVRVIDRVKS